MNRYASLSTRRDSFVLTPLNRATTRRYEACLRNGGHVPSGTIVMREVGVLQVALMECESCLVPYRKRGATHVNAYGQHVPLTVVA